MDQGVYMKRIKPKQNYNTLLRGVAEVERRQSDLADTIKEAKQALEDLEADYNRLSKVIDTASKRELAEGLDGYRAY